jgi:hypothetical protein
MHHTNEKKGSKVTTTDSTANAASPSKNGRFATLCVLLHINGTGALKIRQGSGVSSVRRPGRTFHPFSRLKCCVPVLLGAVAGALAFTAAPALAAAPETPETGKASAVTTTTATLEGGVLNPNAMGEVGEYEYRYRVSETECEGESGTSPEPALGNKKEKVPPVDLTDLQPNAKYTFCLVERNLAQESSALSAPGHFTTKAASPEIELGSLKASNVKASEVTLEGIVNPNNEPTECKFQYGAAYVTENEIACTPELLKGYGGQPVSSTRFNEQSQVTQSIGGLTSHTTYKYRLVAKNGAGEKTEESSFKTAIALEAPEPKPASPITATTAVLHGVLNPAGERKEEPGSYEFLYRQSASECEITQSEREQGVAQLSTPPTAATGAEQETTEAKIENLSSGAQYTFCVRVTNEVGEEAFSAPEPFTAGAKAAAISAEQVTNVEATAVTLNAQIDPDGAETTYYFEYDTSEYKEGEAAHGKKTGEVKIPAGGSAVPAEGKPTEPLTSGTKYYYRAIAVNDPTPGTPVAVDGPGETFTTPAAPTATAETCPNAKARTEQPYGLTLPDCRAYEMVSPINTYGQNATEEQDAITARAAEEGAPTPPTSNPTPAQAESAVTYLAAGTFSGTSGEPTGAVAENQYVSRREPARGGWSTQAITPLHEPDQAESGGSYTQDAFNPQLTKGIAVTNAPLTEGAPITKATNTGSRELGLYLANFADGSYQYIVEELDGLPLGVSSDLSRVVFGQSGGVLEWAGGTPFPVGVDNQDEVVPASVAGWRAVSETGSDVAFMRDGQLYVRVNTDQPQSAVAEPEATGSGTLTKGSKTVSELVVASGILHVQGYAPGTTELEVEPTAGQFVVGQPVTPGSGIEAGTTITKISPGNPKTPAAVVLTLSKPTAEETPVHTVLSSGGPLPFVVGQRVTGAGVPAGTTITGVAEGSLTLSVAAAESETGEQLVGGGGCLVSTDACTVEASASERKAENPAGQQPAQYSGASVDGSKVFFTSKAELTEDAYTGPAGEGSNLYQYEPATSTLTDLTAADMTGAGADVQGVAQISEDGSYIYFVADGDLAGEAQEGQPNLYVIHDAGEPAFITTLGGEDNEVWGTSPETNLASVSPNGQWLAFLSKADLVSKAAGLTGYDNDAAREGECQAEIIITRQQENGHCQEAYLYDAASGRLVCASCNPTGARPVGSANLGVSRYGLYRPRVLTDAGTLFFASYDKLVPGADGLQNVYEYEEGHVEAISDVSGGYPSFLLDTSASGGDVFFASEDRLLPEDPGSDIVVWDARVDGGFPVANPASCQSGESCKPPPTPQPSIYGAPASATFSGAGNPTPAPAIVPVKKKAVPKCKKHYAKNRKGKCVRKKTKKKAKRAINDRRATR